MTAGVKRSRVIRSKRRNRHRIIHSIERNRQAIAEGPMRLAKAQEQSSKRREVA